MKFVFGKLKSSYLFRVCMLCVFLLGAALLLVESSQAEVIVDYFVATSQEGGLLIEWHTSSETNSNGFYLLRSESQNGVFSRINIFFLSDSESGEGVYYSYLDDQVVLGNTYYYQLEAVDLDGTRELFGPIAGIFLSDRTQTATATITAGGPTLTPRPLMTSTPRLSQTISSNTSTPTSRGTVITAVVITPTFTITPVISDTVSSELTATPTLMPLPEFDFLFPAPTAAKITSPPPPAAALELKQTSNTPAPSFSFTQRQAVLLVILLCLWVFLIVFLVLIVRNLFHARIEYQDKD